MDDREKLELFVKRVRELQTLRMVREGMGYQYSLNIDSVKGATLRMEMPDEEDLRSFLLTFRQFISPDEAVFVNHINNICFKRLQPNNQLREQLVKARGEWHRALEGNGVLTFNEQKYSPHDVAKLWLNGHYFHNDDDKYATLRTLMKHGLGFVKAHFMQFIIDATDVIMHMGNVVEYALRNKMFRF